MGGKGRSNIRRNPIAFAFPTVEIARALDYPRQFAGCAGFPGTIALFHPTDLRRPTPWNRC